MLPIPPSSVKGPPSWSSVKRRSWLYPNCLEHMTDNFPQSSPIKTNGSDQHEPMLLPNCFSDSHIQPIKILTLNVSANLKCDF
ncbi:Chromatin assembly factor 1 subunit B [Schistosoma japonicum]|nr:Chromatin assembly factor 1 subunit B [Schistosoma japonicum]